MVTVKFFSLVREALQVEQLVINLPHGVRTLADLKTHLVELNGDHWRVVLFQANMVHALDHHVVDVDTPIKDGAEVAFFPPMTGG